MHLPVNVSGDEKTGHSNANAAPVSGPYDCLGSDYRDPCRLVRQVNELNG
jgi:hypothetical protein